MTRMWSLADKNHTSKSAPNATALLGASPSEEHPGAPNVIYLMLIPFPFFLLQTYVRNLRNLGPLSSVANACVVLGFFSILVFIIKGMLHILIKISLNPGRVEMKYMKLR